MLNTCSLTSWPCGGNAANFIEINHLNVTNTHLPLPPSRTEQALALTTKTHNGKWYFTNNVFSGPH